LNPDLPAVVAAAIRQADDALLDAKSLSLDVVNVLCELYFSMRQYENIISLLEMVGAWWEEDFQSQRIDSAALPLELVVHRGLALLHHAALSDDTVPESTVDVALGAFELLLMKKPSEYSDLYLKVCDAYLDAGCVDLAEQALDAFTRATSAEHSVSNDAPCVLQRRGHVAARRGDWSRAAELYDRAVNTNETFSSSIAALTLTEAQMTELRLSASSAFRRIGDEARSVQLFGDAPVQPLPVEVPGRRSTPAQRSTSKVETSASVATDPEQNVDALIPVAARLLIRHEAGEHKAFVACALPLLLRCLPAPPRCGHAPPDSLLPFTAETLAASSTAATAAPSVAIMFSQPALTLEPVAAGQLVEYHPLPAMQPKAHVEQRAVALSRECKGVIRCVDTCINRHYFCFDSLCLICVFCRRVLVRFHEQERSVAAPGAEPASTESSAQAYERLRRTRQAATQAVNSASLTDRNAAVFDFALRCVRSLVQLRHWVEATFLTRELLLWDEARINHSLFVQALLLGVEVGYAAELVAPDLMLAYECVRQLLHLNPKRFVSVVCRRYSRISLDQIEFVQ
jgi:tetratricopeptide (TPR) repeat protein